MFKSPLLAATVWRRFAMWLAVPALVVGIGFASAEFALADQVAPATPAATSVATTSASAATVVTAEPASVVSTASTTAATSVAATTEAKSDSVGSATATISAATTVVTAEAQAAVAVLPKLTAAKASSQLLAATPVCAANTAASAVLNAPGGYFGTYTVSFNGTFPDGCDVPATLAYQALLPVGWSVTPMSLTRDGVTMTVTASGTVTFEFSDSYRAKATDRWFSGSFTLGHDQSITPGKAYTISWSGTSTVTNITVEVPTCPDCAAMPMQSGKWANSPKVGIGGASQLSGVYSRVIVSTDTIVTLKDTLGVGLACGTATVQQVNSMTGAGQYQGPFVPGATCSGQVAQATVTNPIPGVFYALIVKAVVTDTTLASYVDTGEVTIGGITESTIRTAVWQEGAVGGGGAVKPAITIQKWDTSYPEGDRDTAEQAKTLDPTKPEVVSMTVTNTGNETLVDLHVVDTTTQGSAVLEGLRCDFPDGSHGVTWAGPLAVGASFNCTGTLPQLGYGATHADTAKVDAIGRVSRQSVGSTDDWHGKTLVKPTPTPIVTPSQTSTPSETVRSTLTSTPTTTPAPVLARTGTDLGWTVGLAALLVVAGCLLVAVSTRRRPARKH